MSDSFNSKANLQACIDDLENLDRGTREKVEIVLEAERIYQEMIGGKENEPHSSSIGRQG